MPVASVFSAGGARRVSPATMGFKSVFGTETEGLGVASGPAAGPDLGTSSPPLASSADGQGRRTGVVVESRLAAEDGSRRPSVGDEAAAAASASCSAAMVCEEAAAGDTVARAAATAGVVSVAAGELKVCPTGGRQVFLFSVRLNGRPLLDNWRSRMRVPE